MIREYTLAAAAGIVLTVLLELLVLRTGALLTYQAVTRLLPAPDRKAPQ